jgi:hypothetical protein
MNEAPRAAPQDEEPLEEQPHRRRFGAGCLVRIVLAIVVAVGLIIIIGETFDQGAPETPPDPDDINAGPAEEYALSSVSEWLAYDFYVVRLQDGSHLALHTRSSKQQEQERDDCTVRYDEFAQLSGLAQLPGFTGAFVEECNDLRAVWRVDGAFAGGAGYGDLDRFKTSVDESGNLIVNLDSRICTRSRGVVGQPPFEVRTCDRDE